MAMNFNPHISCRKVSSRRGNRKHFFPGAGIMKKDIAASANDIYELEAENVASKVMQKAAGTGSPFFQPAHSITPIQRKESTGTFTQPVAPSVHQTLNSSGQPMDDTTRSFMESRFGYDFGNVQIHNDSLAHQSSSDINALAYTHSNHVVFGADRYQPGSDQGKQLLAHELVHVIQQTTTGLSYHLGNLTSSIQRYGHDVQNCKQSDVEDILWPADAIARQWLDETISELDLNPQPEYLTPLLRCHFMTDNPSLNVIKQNLNTLKTRFNANDYFYTCREDCERTPEKSVMGGTKVSPLFGGSGPIVLCMNNHRTLPRPDWTCAQTIIHEFMHRYLNFTDHKYCTGCCEGLSSNDALKNPDSYAGLVWDLHFEKLRYLRKKKKKEQLPKPVPEPIPLPFPRTGRAFTTGALLRVRTGPGLKFSTLRLIEYKGTEINVLTQVHSKPEDKGIVDGNDVWNKIADGWVSDLYVNFENNP